MIYSENPYLASGKMDVLLVEDHPENTLMLKNMLTGKKENKFELIHVELLSEAIILLNKKKFDVILLDILLPREYQIDTFIKIKEAANQVPIVVLSSTENEQLAIQMVKNGAYDYFIKDHGDDNLLERSLSYVLERKKIIEKLNEKAIYLDNILNFPKDTSIVITDTNYNIKYLNRTAKKMFGLKINEVIGRSIMEVKLHEKTDSIHFKIALETASKEGEFKYTFEQKKNDRGRYVESKITSILGNNQKTVGFLLETKDITRQKNKSKRLEYRVNFDPKTNLPNQVLFNDRMHQALKRSKRGKHMMALLSLNYSKLNSVNNGMTAETGKLLLKEVAMRLKESMRKSDTMAHIGNNIFTIILSKISNSNDAAIVSQKIITSLARPFCLNSHNLSIQTNIGISMYPADGNYKETLLKNADTAMCHAKKREINNYQFYISGQTDKASDRMTLENHLRQAVENKEFVIHYEPQIDIESGRINGVEALVRWQHPELGLIYPMEFIHIAEDTGLILQIGEWVLRTACSQNKAWQDKGFSPIRMTINISSLQFKRQILINTIRKIIKEVNMEPCYLELELSEKVIMANEKKITFLLHELEDMGVGISIDGFGTGYSSLSSLSRLPINRLKIDRSYIRALVNNADHKAISKVIISMAHSFNFKVIAVGVETLEQLKCLQSLKCNEAQGYFFGKNLSSKEMTELLSKAENNGSIKINKFWG